MSTSANTRILKGTTLKVETTVGSGIFTITTGAIISMPSSFSTPSPTIDVTTAASTIRETRLALPDSGNATFEFFLNMDDAFQQEMEEMADAGETRVFKLVLPEGTLDTGTFSAFVVSTSIAGAFNDVYKMTLVLRVTSALAWAAT